MTGDDRLSCRDPVKGPKRGNGPADPAGNKGSSGSCGKYLSPDAPVLLEHMSTFEEYQKAYRHVAEKAREAGAKI